MRRILLDTNVVLDQLLDRPPFADEAHRIWLASDDGIFDAYISSFSFTTIYYVCQRQQNAQAADAAVDLCLASFEVAALYRECIQAARRMPGPDFEDNLQIACAATDFLHGIVTRNPADFVGSPVRIYMPAEFLQEINR